MPPSRTSERSSAHRRMPSRGCCATWPRCWRKNRALLGDDLPGAGDELFLAVGLLDEAGHALGGEAAGHILLAVTAAHEHAHAGVDFPQGAVGALSVEARHGEVQQDEHDLRAVRAEDID